MFHAIRAFFDGLGYHRRGIRFVLAYRSIFMLLMLPFLTALVLYVTAFYLFALYAPDLLNAIWPFDPQPSSRILGWIHWAYMHIVRYVLYLVILVMMFYTFIVLSNIIGSPIYDYVSAKYERVHYRGRGEQEGRDGTAFRWLLAIREEIKKALLILLIPLILFFIPFVGAALALLVAPVLTAWDYVDFSIARDHVLLRERLAIVWRNKFHLLGFGVPILIPVIGVLLMPFAAVGATQLYLEKMKGR